MHIEFCVCRQKQIYIDFMQMKEMLKVYQWCKYYLVIKLTSEKDENLLPLNFLKDILLTTQWKKQLSPGKVNLA